MAVMTLSEILPSLASLLPPNPPPVPPVDPEAVRLRAKMWQAALPDAEVVYSSSPVPCSVAHMLATTSMSWEIHTAFDLAVAVGASFPPDRMIGHARSATPELLTVMQNAGIERFVVDTPEQLQMLAACTLRRCRVTLQLEAFQGDTFGDDTIDHAVSTVITDPAMEFAGFRTIVGDSAHAVDRAIAAAMRQFRRARASHGVAGTELQLMSSATGLVPYSLATATTIGLNRHCRRFPRPRVTHVVDS